MIIFRKGTVSVSKRSKASFISSIHQFVKVASNTKNWVKENSKKESFRFSNRFILKTFISNPQFFFYYQFPNKNTSIPKWMSLTCITIVMVLKKSKWEKMNNLSMRLEPFLGSDERIIFVEGTFSHSSLFSFSSFLFLHASVLSLLCFMDTVNLFCVSFLLVHFFLYTFMLVWV